MVWGGWILTDRFTVVVGLREVKTQVEGLEAGGISVKVVGYQLRWLDTNKRIHPAQ